MLYKLIKDKQLEARKNKESTLINLLTTLLGEIQTSVTGGLSASQVGILNPSDEEVLKVIKKFVKNSKEGFQLTGNVSYQEEINILSEFLPKQLTETELKKVIETIIKELPEGSKTIGAIMGKLKAEYLNLYDNKLASNLIKQLLN